jgi:hypothetical protein
MNTSMLPTQVISLCPLAEHEYNKVLRHLRVGEGFLLYTYSRLYHGPKLYRIELTGLNVDGQPVCTFNQIYYDDGSWHFSPAQSVIWPKKPTPGDHRGISELEYDLLPETDYTHRMCKRAIMAWQENDKRHQMHAAEKQLFMSIFQAMKIELPEKKNLTK